MSDKIGVVFAGSADVSAVALQKLLDCEFCEVQAILTNPDKPAGRKQRLTPNPLKSFALLNCPNIPIIEDLAELHSYVSSLNADKKPTLGIAVAYGKLLKTADLELFDNGWINLHFSLLPAYRGASPVQTAILDGIEETGVTVFKIREGLDDGEIISQKSFAISENCTSDELFAMISPFGADVLVESVLQIFNGSATYTPQPTDPELISHTKKLLKSDSRIDWSLPDEQIVHKINAFSSNPGAWFELLQDGKPPLRVVAIKARLGDDGKVELLQVKPAGKNVMSYADWVRGLRDSWQIA